MSDLSPPENPPTLNVPYLARIGVGLGLLAGWAWVSMWLPSSGLAGFGHTVVLALLAATGIGLPLWAWWRYRRMDELQQRLHERASTFALGAGAGALLVVELLHGQGLVPAPSALTVATALLGLWGLGLMLAHEKAS